MKKGALFGLLLACALILTISVFFFSGKRNNDTRKNPGFSSKSKKKDSNNPKHIKESKKTKILEYSWNAGEHRKYSLSFHTDIIIKTSSEQMQFSKKISGTLHQKIYKIEKGRIWQGFSMENLKLSITGASPLDISLYQRALHTEVYVVVRPNGLIERWMLGPIYGAVPGKGPKKNNIAEDLANTYKSLLASIQVVLPDKYQKKWQTEEEADLNGKYTAQYSLGTEKSDKIMIRKQKISYRNPEFKAQLRKLSSDGSAAFYPEQGLCRNISLEEIVSIFVDKTAATEGKITLELKLLEIKHDKKIITGFSQDKIEATSRLITKIDPERQRLARILGDMNWKDFLSEFATLRAQENIGRRNELFRKLAAFMELYPDKIPLIAEQILSAGELDPVMETMLDALSMVKHPKAQSALAQIIEQSSDNADLLNRAVASLGGVKKPTEKTVSVLQQIFQTHESKEIKNTASLALGSVAGELPPGQSQAIVAELENTLQSAEDIGSKRALIEALGNAGSDSSLPHIENYLEEKDESTRGSALAALRFIADKRADKLLAQSLTKETSSNVRYQVLESLSYRKPTQESFQALSQSIAREKIEELRIKQAFLLWKMRKQFPNAENIVKNMVKEDPSEAVRSALEIMMLTE